MATKQALLSGYDSHVIEWSDLRETDGDGDIPPASFPDHPEMSIQLIEVSGTTPTIIPEWSNNLEADSPRLFAPGNDYQKQPISLTTAGQGEQILESGVLMRPRVSGGSGVVAKARIKFTRTAS